MNTSKPFSTITYNTPKYLQNKLDDFVEEGILAFYSFIKHNGEDDEGGKKDHIHLYIIPSKRVNTEALANEFCEIPEGYQPHEGEKIPYLKWLICQSSKFDDWEQYTLHDALYISSKGLSKKFVYTTDDYITSDLDTLNSMIKQINTEALTPYRSIQQAIQDGITWQRFVLRGTIPINQLGNFERAWDSIYLALHGHDRLEERIKKYKMAEFEQLYSDKNILEDAETRRRLSEEWKNR